MNGVDIGKMNDFGKSDLHDAISILSIYLFFDKNDKRHESDDIYLLTKMKNGG